MTAPAVARTSQVAPARAGTAMPLRRKCACGTHVPGGGECADCARKRERRGTGAVDVPPSVHAVLGRAGTTLDASVRTRMERGFGRDFSGVRVHDDALAARSAAEVGAAAYTVGSHVVFGAGRHAPDSAAGLHLLAHELAHVVQQGAGGGLMRKSIGSLFLGEEDSPAEREADRAADSIVRGGRASVGMRSEEALQRAPRRTPAIVGLDPAGPDADLTGRTETALWQCMKGTAGFPLECPQAPLTWADYPVGRGRGGFSANTGWDVKDKPMEPKVAECVRRLLGWSEDRTHVFQATFSRRGAFVQRQFADPGNPAATGCDKPVRQCRQHFARRLPANQTAGDFTFSARPDRRCPALATPATVTVSASADCHLIGDECTRTAQAESVRLLRHEQGHMDIACAMARKFNQAIANGTSFALLNRNPVAFIQRIQDRYDAQTHHGCLPGPQAAWEAEIAKGLPNEALPQPRPTARTRPVRRRP